MRVSCLQTAACGSPNAGVRLQTHSNLAMDHAYLEEGTEKQKHRPLALNAKVSSETFCRCWNLLQLLTVFGSIHAGPRIDYSQLIIPLTHLASRTRMVESVENRSDVLKNLIIGRNIWTRDIFRANKDALHDGRRQNLSGTLEPTNSGLDISIRGQPIRVNQRLVMHAG